MFKVQSFARKASRPFWVRSSQVTALLFLGLLGLQTTAAAQQVNVDSIKLVEQATLQSADLKIGSIQPNAHQSAIQLAMASAVPLPRSVGNHLQDGVHVFGEANEREQLGRTYMVFEVKNRKVLGAVFSPQSSYSCFEGRFNNNQLALRVEDPYDNSIYTHEIALEETAIVASSDLQSVEMQLGLEGMQPLRNLREQEASMLATCQAEL